MQGPVIISLHTHPAMIHITLASPAPLSAITQMNVATYAEKMKKNH